MALYVISTSYRYGNFLGFNLLEKTSPSSTVVVLMLLNKTHQAYPLSPPYSTTFLFSAIGLNCINLQFLEYYHDIPITCHQHIKTILTNKKKFPTIVFGTV